MAEDKTITVLFKSNESDTSLRSDDMDSDNPEFTVINNSSVNQDLQDVVKVEPKTDSSSNSDIEMNMNSDEIKPEEISCLSVPASMPTNVTTSEGTSTNDGEIEPKSPKSPKEHNKVSLIQGDNQSLRLLHAYDNDDDDDDEDDDESSDEDDDDEEDEVVFEGEYRDTREVVSEDSDQDSDSDSSSSSSSTSLFFSNASDSESDNNEVEQGAVQNKTKKSANQPLRTKGELTLEDLPPIEDLKISVAESDCVAVGKVYRIVDKLVVVEALKNTPVLDLDSVLFFEGGQPLGHVFDVFGPVTEPYYCVRFNSSDHIKQKNIVKDQIVYCAPKTEYTSYVFVNQLLKMKGSDASWKHNNEPPPNQLDYSDDEEERRAKKAARRPPVRVDREEDFDTPPRKRPTAYEQRMNERNLQMNMRASNRQNEWRERTPFTERRGPAVDVVWTPAMPQPVFEHPTPVIPTSFPVRPANPAFGSHPFIGPAPVIHNNIPRQQQPPPVPSSQFFLTRPPFNMPPPFSPPPLQRTNPFFDPRMCMTPPPPPYRY